MKTILMVFAIVALGASVAIPWAEGTIVAASTPSPNPTYCYPPNAITAGTSAQASPLATNFAHAETCGGQYGDTFSDGQFYTPAPTSTANSFQYTLPANVFALFGRRVYVPSTVLTAPGAATSYCFLDSSGWPYGLWYCSTSNTAPNPTSELEYTITANVLGVTTIVTPPPVSFYLNGSYYGDGSHLNGVNDVTSVTGSGLASCSPTTGAVVCNVPTNGPASSPCPGFPACVALQSPTASPSPQSGTAAINGNFAALAYIFSFNLVSSVQSEEFEERSFVSSGNYMLEVRPQPTTTASPPGMYLFQLGCNDSGGADVCATNDQKRAFRLALSSGGANTTWMGTDANQSCPNGGTAGAWGIGFALTYSLTGFCVDGNGGIDSGMIFNKYDSFHQPSTCMFNANSGSHGHGLCLGSSNDQSGQCDSSKTMYLDDSFIPVCYVEGDSAGNITIKHNLTVNGTLTATVSTPTPIPCTQLIAGANVTITGTSFAFGGSGCTIAAGTSSPSGTPTPASYAAMVKTDAPSYYWDLSDSAGPAAESQQGQSAVVTGSTVVFHSSQLPNGDYGVAFPTASPGGCLTSAANNYGLANNAQTEVTAEAWVKIPSSGFAGGTIFQSNTSNSNGGWRFEIDSGNHIQWTPQGITTVHSSFTITTGVWHQVDAAYNGNTVTFCADGCSQTSIIQASHMQPDNIGNYWLIGGTNTGGGTCTTAGGNTSDLSIAKLAIWMDRLLPQARMLAHYNGGNAGTYTNPW